MARALQGNPALSAAPIVAGTSYAMSGNRLSALAAGCDAYIEKPIDPDQFPDQVSRIAAAGRRNTEE